MLISVRVTGHIHIKQIYQNPVSIHSDAAHTFAANFKFGDIDFLNKNDTPPYGLPLNSSLAFIPDTPYVLYSSKY